MQLGVSLDNVLAEITQNQPDILGVSATFGQHDLMTRLLDEVFGLDTPPLVLAGGSLTARNERLLLDRYPQLLVARGAGEPTMQDAISYWHGDLTLPDIRGIGYAGGTETKGTALLQVSRHRRTATIANRVQTDTLPELDLLDATFSHQGVAQLETSRGCTNFCSFCPRGHKGTWSGATPPGLTQILAAMSEVYDRHPQTSRTLYLVDEEFIGGDADAVTRALAVAGTVHEAGFRWESSCRVDQVVNPRQDREWHIERARMWRGLLDRGLRRMLFGVESGVTSVLERFNKETTAEQNALAIRTLTALGVPTRFTYITFDPLMTRDELAASYAFQSRTDLLLRPMPHLPVEAIVDGVRDETFVAAHTTGRALHSGISYMLVSMECLIGAAYTRRAEQAGLTRTVRPSMGRVDAEYADWRIGRASHHAQLWIDRNFAFDYTLKSLEKILDGRPRRQVRAARVVLKDAAAALLGRMLDVIDEQTLGTPATAGLDAALIGLLNRGLDELREAMEPTVIAVVAALPPDHGAILYTAHSRWVDQTGWELINAADPCGT
ncbi:radical SAM protein [Micromonospora sp. NPDC048063]|uniref:radical SAM protein n=1 Tax=Micromonospora sp. NPDC048063 TaxID=3364256 RepID=UPI00371610B9